LAAPLFGPPAQGLIILVMGPEATPADAQLTEFLVPPTVFPLGRIIDLSSPP